MLYDELNDTEAFEALPMARAASLMCNILMSIHHVRLALPYWDAFAFPRMLAMPISDTSIMG